MVMQNGGVRVHVTLAKEHCCVLRNNLFNCLTLSQKEELASVIHHSKIMHRGERLFRQGDPFYRVYLIGSGSFKSSISDESGNLQVTAFNYSSDILGLDGLHLERHVYEVEALETSSICSLPFSILEEILGADQSKFYHQLISRVYNEDFCSSHSSMMFCRMRAEQRLARFLLGLSKSMGNRGCSKLEFGLTMTRHDIASYLGIAAETLSRLFRRFQDERLIKVMRSNVLILDLEGLRAVVAAENGYFGLRNLGLQNSKLKKSSLSRVA